MTEVTELPWISSARDIRFGHRYGCAIFAMVTLHGEDSEKGKIILNPRNGSFEGATEMYTSCDIQIIVAALK